jgi:hypothetical protein
LPAILRIVLAGSSGRHGIAETVEFPVSRASEKGPPFLWGKPEEQLLRVPAVADADAAVVEICDLNAVAVSKAQRALNPAHAL